MQRSQTTVFYDIRDTIAKFPEDTRLNQYTNELQSTTEQLVKSRRTTETALDPELAKTFRDQVTRLATYLAGYVAARVIRTDEAEMLITNSTEDVITSLELKFEENETEEISDDTEGEQQNDD